MQIGDTSEDMAIPGDGTEMTQDSCMDLARIVWNLPGMVWGEHLERTDDQIRPFAREMFRYCKKKQIDPSDYLFDEFGLVIIGLGVAGGMRRDHAAWKKNEISSRTHQNVGLGVTHDPIHSDEVEKVAPVDLSKVSPVSGGD